MFTWEEYSKSAGIDRPDEGIDLVAKHTDGTFCAIQCKCYAPDGSIDLKALGTFVTACKTYNINRLILAYTGDHITEKAEFHLKKNNGSIITSEILRSSSVDWSQFPKLKVREPYDLYDYQKEAVKNTVTKFQKSDRGQLLMACGTGKTLVSLRIAEKVAPANGIILYLVPSITLIQQSMRSWSENRVLEQSYIGVCSDKSVSGEDGSIVELESPVSTNPNDLREAIRSRPQNKQVVIFCTYNSIQVVADALGKNAIDLALCDEAHRTIGGADQSFFTKIHEDSVIKVSKRLYMTATPKIFTDKIRRAADAQEKKIYAMDDQKVYGQIFYELKFDEAVHKYKALSDYRVRIAFIDSKYMDPELQSSMADSEGLLPLSAQNKMVSLWHSLQHPDYDDDKTNLLQRVIVFSNTINASKLFAGETEDKQDENSFAGIVQKIKETVPTAHGVDVKHIDGKTRALERKKQLRWLEQSDKDPNRCRLLSNARCLSEGVDVPALDGVVFMEPRKSMVDVIQSVGRVMRKHAGKEYGYVILPVAIPANEDINKTLDDGKTWKVVWEVLNALRSHDPDLASAINQLVLEKKISGDGKIGEKIRLLSISDRPDDPGYQKFLGKFYSKIKSKLVEKVGDINYYDKHGQKIGRKSRTIETKIREKIESSPAIKTEITKFHEGLKQMVNDSVTYDATVRVIAQHMVLSRVFDSLFQNEFTSHNPISVEFEKIIKKIGLREELEELETFYADVDIELKNITSRDARQNFIKKIYGNFFESVDKKGTEQHGVVYTPVEIIDFIIHSTQHLLQKHFGIQFNDRAVKVLEPFAGTGTFITRLLESGLITDNMFEKYKHDLYANELILLAYYVATVNIETTYSSLRRGNNYVPFDGISYTDTLKIDARYRTGEQHRQQETKLHETFKVAHERVRRQRGSRVHVIIGNPPYSVHQSDYNDDAQNMKYHELDLRIADTYRKKANVSNINSLYDSYIRSIRWASDRIEESGIIAFVTNASFIRSDATAGLRACLQEEFNEIWCFDLRGNARTKGDLRRREGGNVFGLGSRAPVSITLLIKNPSKKKGCTIHYKDIGDYHDRDKKLEIIRNAKSIQGIKAWQIIQPDKHHDWLNYRNNEFSKYLPMGSKEAKSRRTVKTIFNKYSLGVATHRDVWAYNSSRNTLSNNMKKHIEYCNNANLNKITYDSTKVKWDEELKTKLQRFGKQKFDATKIRTSLYRPFFKQILYFDNIFNTRRYLTSSFFPKNNSENLVICIPSKFAGNFSVFLTNVVPDLQVIQNGQCFPRYIYENNDNDKKDNITNPALHEYQNHYNDTKITKKSIFYYTYGLLHHQVYRKKFANNLIRELPHIPMAPNFWKFSDAGEQLANLHLNFETCKRYNLGHPKTKLTKFTKLSFGRKAIEKNGKIKKIDDKTTIRVDGTIVFDNIPETAYAVNGRTPLGWIIDRYRITTDKDSGITNDPCTGTDIIPIIERAVYVGIESDKIIAQISKLPFEPKNWTPAKTGLDKY